MEIRPSKIMIGILIIALGISIASLIASETTKTYNLESPTGFNFSDYDLSGDTTELALSMKNKMLNQTTGTLDFISSFLQSIWESIKLTFKSLDFVSNLLSNLVRDLGLPPFFYSIFIAIIIIGFIFAIIYAFFKITNL